MSSEYRSMRAELTAQVVELVDAFRSPITQIEFLYLLANARSLNQPLSTPRPPPVWSAPIHGSWIALAPKASSSPAPATSLRPDVEAASVELGLAEEWIGKHDREVQILPVLKLGESAMRLGLLRRYRGMLLATHRGRKLRDDPLGLWWHLAEQLPPTKIARHVTRCRIFSTIEKPECGHRATPPASPNRVVA